MKMKMKNKHAYKTSPENPGFILGLYMLHMLLRSIENRESEPEIGNHESESEIEIRQPSAIA
jgi:hypothetical protein